MKIDSRSLQIVASFSLLLLVVNLAPVRAFAQNYTLSEWTLNTPNSQPHEVNLTPDGEVWFTEKGLAGVSSSGPFGRIGHLNPYSNAITEWILPGSTFNATNFVGPEYIKVDTSGTIPIVWFDLRPPALGPPRAGGVARLQASTPTGSLLVWPLTNPSVPCTIPNTDIHGLDVTRNSTGGFTSIWFIEESSPSCGAGNGPFKVQLTTPATLTLTYYSPMVLAGANSVGDFLLVGKNGTVWFATDLAGIDNSVFQLNPANCPGSSCTYGYWPILAGSGPGLRPQGMGIDSTGALWIENRGTSTFNNKTGTTITEQHPTRNLTVSTEFWITPNLINGPATNGGNIADESDLIVAPSDVIWFSEHGEPNSKVAAFDENLQAPDFASSVLKSISNVSIISFNNTATPLPIRSTTYSAPYAQRNIGCSAPSGYQGFSECAPNIASFTNGGPNGLAYQQSTGCLWFVEQEANKVGRLCLFQIASTTALPISVFLMVAIALPVLSLRVVKLRRKA